MKITLTIAALVLLAAPGTTRAQYKGAFSKTFHKDVHELSQHLVVVSSFTMYLASQALKRKKGRKQNIKFLTKYLKTSSMAVIEMRHNLTAMRQAFLELSSKKTKATLFKGRRSSRKDLKLLVHKYVAGLDNFYALSGSLVQRFVPGKERKEMGQMIVNNRNTIRAIANRY